MYEYIGKERAYALAACATGSARFQVTVTSRVLERVEEIPTKTPTSLVVTSQVVGCLYSPEVWSAASLSFIAWVHPSRISVSNISFSWEPLFELSSLVSHFPRDIPCHFRSHSLVFRRIYFFPTGNERRNLDARV